MYDLDLYDWELQPWFTCTVHRSQGKHPAPLPTVFLRDDHVSSVYQCGPFLRLQMRCLHVEQLGLSNELYFVLYKELQKKKTIVSVQELDSGDSYLSSTQRLDCSGRQLGTYSHQSWLTNTYLVWIKGDDVENVVFCCMAYTRKLAPSQEASFTFIYTHDRCTTIKSEYEYLPKCQGKTGLKHQVWVWSERWRLTLLLNWWYHLFPFTWWRRSSFRLVGRRLPGCGKT